MTFTWQKGVSGLGGPWGKPDVGGCLVRDELKEEGPGDPSALSARARFLWGEVGEGREMALPGDMLAGPWASSPLDGGAERRPPGESSCRWAGGHLRGALAGGP